MFFRSFHCKYLDELCLCRQVVTKWCWFHTSFKFKSLSWFNFNAWKEWIELFVIYGVFKWWSTINLTFCNDFSIWKCFLLGPTSFVQEWIKNSRQKNIKKYQYGDNTSKKYRKNERYLCLVTRRFTKLSLNVCLINAYIFLYQYVRRDCILWSIPWF